jgi:hypothetical protein
MEIKVFKKLRESWRLKYLKSSESWRLKYLKSSEQGPKNEFKNA